MKTLNTNILFLFLSSLNLSLSFALYSFFHSLFISSQLLNGHEPNKRTHTNATTATTTLSSPLSSPLRSSFSSSSTNSELLSAEFDLPFSIARETIEGRLRAQMQRYRYVRFPFFWLSIFRFSVFRFFIYIYIFVFFVFWLFFYLFFCRFY
jgi:hypothetical protein